MPRSTLVRVLIALVLVLVVATVAGLVVLWPEEGKVPRPEELGAPPETEQAEVVGVRSAPCGQGVGRADCLRVSAAVQSGPDEGREVTFTFAAAEGQFEVGDDIRVYKTPPLPPEAIAAG